MVLCDWLLQLSIFSRLIHVAACISNWFLWPNTILLNGHTTFCLSIHSLVNGHLGCFHTLSIINNAAKSIYIQDFMCTYVFISLGYVSRNEVAGYGNSVFNFLRNYQIIFQSGCTVLYSTSNVWDYFSTSLSTLILPVFLIIAILVDLKWYLTMVLFCISVMTNDVEKFSCAYQFNIFLLNRCLHFKTFVYQYLWKIY